MDKCVFISAFKPILTIFLKTIYARYFLLMLLSATILRFESLAEGTRELMPVAGTPNYLQLFDNNDLNRSFASYIADDEHALKITIANPGEVIYFGFRPEAALDGTGCNRLWYRIRDPLGNIVFGPQECAITGAGSIANYAQAIAGPNALVGGAGGYTPLFYEPTSPGDFTIEFNRNNPNTFVNTITNCTGSRVKSTLVLSDITVADGLNGNAILGRLWSKTWDCTSMAFANPMNNSFFVYDDDGYVFEVNLNGAQPFGFEFRANYTGLTNTGNPIADRRSRAGNFGFSELKIFLNDPDPLAFPSGVLPGVLSLSTINNCSNGTFCIEVSSVTASQARLILNFNGIPGYQDNTSDLDISTNLSPGTTCIPWDGRDGLGALIAEGTNIEIEIENTSKTIHLPVFDVENNPNGFLISHVRPAGVVSFNQYFDDLAIPGGTINLAGCNPCHTWSGTLAPNGTTPAVNWGNNRTINTWFYGLFNSTNTLQTLPSVTGSAEAGANQTLCAPSLGNTISLSGNVSNATSQTWISSGDGTFSPSATSLTATYTLGVADIAAGQTRIVLSASTAGLCNTLKEDSVFIYSEATPEVLIANNLLLITDDAEFIEVQATLNNSTAMYWLSDGGGNFLDSTAPSTRYFLSEEDKIKGSVSLSAWSDGQVACAARFGIITVNITAVPCQEPEFPEGFSPNEDNLNDYFIVQCLSSVSDNLLEVYDRDGKKVYEANEYNNQWNGLNMRGQELPDDTYFYTFRSQEKLWKGAVEIRR
jgi:gliding motility-associated-like protein